MIWIWIWLLLLKNKEYKIFTTTNYFQEKRLQGINAAKNWRTAWEWCRLCSENKWVSLFAFFDLPESSHAHRSHCGPGIWGLSQAESAARTAERRRTGGRKERQGFVCQRYRDSSARKCSGRLLALLCDGCRFGKHVLLLIQQCWALSWLLASPLQRIQGRKSRKLLFQLQGCVLNNKKARKTGTRLMKWCWREAVC